MPSWIAEVITTAITVIMCFIGLFGNICMLWAHACNKHLRHKLSYIVTVIAFLHAICLFNELYVEARQLRFHPASRSECFRQTCVYVFVFMAQAAMFLMLAVDYLLAVTIPLRHQVFPTAPYVFYLCVPPFLFASAIVTFSVIFMNDDHIELCTPIQAMPQNVQSVMYVIIVLDVAVLLTLTTVIALGRWRRKKRRSLSSAGQPAMLRTSVSVELKMMRSFIVLVVVFVCSWCVSTISTHIVVEYFRPKSEISLFVQTYVVLTVVPTYCQCYFVSYFHSPLHRSVYQKQLRVLFPCFFNEKQNEPSHQKDVHDMRITTL